MKIEWTLVKGWGGKNIGAIGFIGNTASVIVSFYEDADFDKDGTISLREKIVFKVSPFVLKNQAVTNVAMQARADPDIILRDMNFNRMAMSRFVGFAGSLVIDGIYKSYLAWSMAYLIKGIAVGATTSLIKRAVIKKGMEKAVEKAVKAFKL